MNVTHKHGVLRSAFSSALAAPTLAVCLAGASCGGTDAASSTSSSSASVSEKSHPDPVVSVQLDKGSTLEFYDLHDRVMISEVGPADHAPLAPQYIGLVKSYHLVDLFSALRPDLQVPKQLQDLQTKYRAYDEVVATGGVSQSVRGGSGLAEGNPAAQYGQSNDGGGLALGTSSPSAGGGAPGILPQDCGNNCCSASWTQGTLCGPGYSGATYSWYLFDYGYSYANGWYSQFWGAVCAATGTSSWTLSSTDGFGGTWSVPEGYYRWESDDPHCSGGGFCAGPTVTTTVNNEENQELHTYCGGLWQNG